MASNAQTDKLTKDEAQDLANKLQQLDPQLSPKQRKFMHFAVNALSRKNEQDVKGYDYEYIYDTGYYDLSTGYEIYAVDWYSNYGSYEGTTYYE